MAREIRGPLLFVRRFELFAGSCVFFFSELAHGLTAARFVSYTESFAVSARALLCVWLRIERAAPGLYNFILT